MAFHPDSRQFCVHGATSDEIFKVATALVPMPTAEFVILKRALTVGNITTPVSQTHRGLQELMGGPSGLSSSLAGAAMGGLTGYGLGRLYDKTVPGGLKHLLGDENIDEEGSRMGLMLGAAGAGFGASPGLLKSYVQLSNGQAPWTKTSAAAHAADLDDVDEQFKRASAGAGGLFIPSIPVDAFNRAVWSDVAQPQNPFGTKSHWGDNSQPMHTPPAVAAAVSGLVAGAAAATGRDSVSPWDVAQVAARAGINAGIGALAGAATGIAVGKTLGALAGLSPVGQKYLQTTGTWGGALTGLVQRLF